MVCNDSVCVEYVLLYGIDLIALLPCTAPAEHELESGIKYNPPK